MYNCCVSCLDLYPSNWNLIATFKVSPRVIEEFSSALWTVVRKEANAIFESRVPEYVSSRSKYFIAGLGKTLLPASEEVNCKRLADSSRFSFQWKKYEIKAEFCCTYR